ncbi:MAG: sigma-70 family RNA polymerase sigma factor, partial [Solirubrobacterales bacterium]|nr:sigma-70 family RNA polymerase sigma factor [Solirubrobacterales bacterium]
MLGAALLRTQPDDRLAALANQGSERAFEVLVQRHRRALHGFCRRLLLADARAEDAVQQALLSTWQQLRRGTVITDVRAYLFRATHHAAIEQLRRSRMRFDELSDALHGADAPEADLARRTAVREALAGLAALPELQREALLRTAIDGASYEEVAAALG